MVSKKVIVHLFIAFYNQGFEPSNFNSYEFSLLSTLEIFDTKPSNLKHFKLPSKSI